MTGYLIRRHPDGHRLLSSMAIYTILNLDSGIRWAEVIADPKHA
jgi:hypothetical protein